jgi:hypothetical protein
LLLVFQPNRDVWVEEGMESKVPYWGLSCALGTRWTIPVRGLARAH